MSEEVTNEDVLEALRTLYKMIDTRLSKIEQRLDQLEKSSGSKDSKPKAIQVGAVKLFQSWIALEIKSIFYNREYQPEKTEERTQLVLTSIDLHLNMVIEPKKVREDYTDKNGKERYRMLYCYPQTVEVYDAMKKALKHLKEADDQHRDYYIQGLTNDFRTAISKESSKP